MSQRLVIPKHTARPTFLYLIREQHGLYKVGIAHNVRVRLSTLQSATPYELTVCATVEVKRGLQAEAFVHSLLEPYHVKGEWFKLPSEQTFHNAVKKYRAALRVRRPREPAIVLPEPEPWPDYNDFIRSKLLKRDL
jgi:hypothetical protein